MKKEIEGKEGENRYRIGQGKEKEMRKMGSDGQKRKRKRSNQEKGWTIRKKDGKDERIS